MGEDLREQVSDHCGVDLEASATSHALDFQDICRVENFFKGQADRLGAFVMMARRKQQAGEPAAQYVAELKRMAQFTQFGELNSQAQDALVLGMFIAGMSSEEQRQKLLEIRSPDGATPSLKRY